MSVSALRQQLAALLPPPRAGDGVAIPTGIEALDRALSDGGVPSGRLTEIQGARGSGRTTLVRHLVQTAVEARRWVAVIDGSRTLAPREWAEAGDSGRLWMHPPARRRPQRLVRRHPVAKRRVQPGGARQSAPALPPGRGPPDEAREGTRRRAGDRGRQPGHRECGAPSNHSTKARGQKPEASENRFTIHDSRFTCCRRVTNHHSSR